MRLNQPMVLLALLFLPLMGWLAWPRRQPFGRRYLFLALRTAILLALILALAGLEAVIPTRRLAAVFLLDRSASMTPAAKARALEYIRQSLPAMRPEDLAAVVTFGSQAVVERPLSADLNFPDPGVVVQPHATDLAAAFRLGLALLPPGSAGRLVVLSDGAINAGNTQAALRLAQASGVDVWVVPLVDAPGAEVLVRDFVAPTRLRPGEHYSLEVTLESNTLTTARLRLIAGEVLAYEAQVQVARGLQTFSLPLVAPDDQSGTLRYLVQIEPELDHAYQNNQLAAFSFLAGPPRLLLVAPQPGERLPGGQERADEALHLQQVLAAARFDVQRLTPERLPSDPLILSAFSSIVLVDVPARQLAPRQQQALHSYVRDLGGGLLAVGGPTSFGTGGYFQTPLEEVLPVEMQIQDPLRRPPVTILFVIDHSGSMGENSSGATRLQFAQEAALRSLELLFPGDRVGVIAFDENASWIVPMTGIENRAAIRAAILGLTIGGGTDILSGVQAAAQELANDPAQVRHILLLTDGGADPTGIPELVESLLANHGITFSSVGIGPGAAPFLPDLAARGGGRYYLATDPASIPSIFTEEISLAARSYLEEHTFIPQRVSASALLAGLGDLPALDGYVITSPKSLAQTALVSDLGDPILATWQYGLGRAAAFTSDASPRWASSWLGWPGFPRFWGQLVDWLQPALGANPLEARLEQTEGVARLVLEARQPDGTSINQVNFIARLVAPEGQLEQIELEQQAPGLYTAYLPGLFSAAHAGESGVVLYGISGRQADSGETYTISGGWSVPYSPEYALDSSDPEQLCALEQDVQACVQAAADGTYHHPPNMVFSQPAQPSLSSQPLWPWLLAVAACLLPLDVASRRLYLSPGELSALAQRLFPLHRLRGWRQRPDAAPLPPDSAALAALRQARTTRRSAGTDPGSPSPAQKNTAPDTPSAIPAPPAGAENNPPPAISRTPFSGKIDAEPGGTAAALLAARRRRETHAPAVPPAPPPTNPPGPTGSSGEE